MELLGLWAEGMGGGARWGWSGRLRTVSALMSQPMVQCQIITVLIPSTFPNNLNPQTRYSLSKYFKAAWVCPSPSKQHCYCDLRLWASACKVQCLKHTHYSSWDLSCLHWSPSSWEDRAVWEAWVSPGAQLQGVWVEALLLFISRLLPLPALQLCLLPCFSPLWRRISSCCSRDTLLLMGRNCNLPRTCPGSNSRPAQFLVVVLLPPSKCHRPCAMEFEECFTGKYTALTGYG